jgi:hypothetical protein
MGRLPTSRKPDRCRLRVSEDERANTVDEQPDCSRSSDYRAGALVNAC